MRDLNKYPITRDEIVKCLMDVARELEKTNALGDMCPVLLREAAKLVGK